MIYGCYGWKWFSYFNSTVAPAASSFALISLASASATPSLTTLGAPSTKSLASFSPSPVIVLTSLITFIFWAPAAVKWTSNSVLASAAGAESPPPAAETATGAAAALTPHFSSKIF